MRISYDKTQKKYFIWDSYGFPIGSSKTLEGAKLFAKTLREQLEKQI